MNIPSLRTLLQISGIFLAWLGAVFLVNLTGLPLPGGILALAVLLLLLFTGVLRLDAIRGGADWLLAQMLLFFVPALVAVIQYPQFLGMLGVKILLVILLSTLAVMAVTSLVVGLATRHE